MTPMAGQWNAVNGAALRSKMPLPASALFFFPNHMRRQCRAAEPVAAGTSCKGVKTMLPSPCEMGGKERGEAAAPPQ